MAKYAGIGSRNTPKPVLDLMYRTAKVLTGKGYTLASGDAKGADQAFIAGAVDGYGKVIHCLPWDSYERGWRQCLIPHDGVIRVYDPQNDHAATESVRKFHPAPGRLSQGAVKLHARNYLILEGSEFVICWTKDGRDSGGTGQGLRIARALNIPVYNLYFESVRKAFENRLSELA